MLLHTSIPEHVVPTRRQAPSKALTLDLKHSTSASLRRPTSQAALQAKDCVGFDWLTPCKRSSLLFHDDLLRNFEAPSQLWRTLAANWKWGQVKKQCLLWSLFFSIMYCIWICRFGVVLEILITGQFNFLKSILAICHPSVFEVHLRLWSPLCNAAKNFQIISFSVCICSLLQMGCSLACSKFTLLTGAADFTGNQ